MKTETLVATIDQTDMSLIGKMNIQTDALIGNQCGRASEETVYLNGNRIVYLNTAERGVGRNRNLLIERATGDICICADDDMRFKDGYPEIAMKAFGECPDADILLFNLIEKNPRRYINKKIMRVRRHNYAKYGAARMAFRREAVQTSGISFNLSFGGGARYGSGEDTVFLKECLDKGLRIYAVPYFLAEIDQAAASTWFSGHDVKFFRDKGALYACLHPIAWRAYIIRFVIRYRKKYSGEMTLMQALKHMLAGGREYLSEAEE